LDCGSMDCASLHVRASPRQNLPARQQWREIILRIADCGLWIVDCELWIEER
jgi:hypothetical protein